MTENELGWFAVVILLLILDLVFIVVAAWGWAAMRRAYQESERWRTAFEDSEADLASVIAWREKAIVIIASHPETLAEALDDELVRDVPLIIGGQDAGPAAVYPVFAPGNVEKDTNAQKG